MIKIAKNIYGKDKYGVNHQIFVENQEVTEHAYARALNRFLISNVDELPEVENSAELLASQETQVEVKILPEEFEVAETEKQPDPVEVEEDNTDPKGDVKKTKKK